MNTEDEFKLGDPYYNNPYLEEWEEKYDGKCDLCGQEKPFSEIAPGVQFGFKVGYVCKGMCVKPK